MQLVNACHYTEERIEDAKTREKWKDIKENNLLGERENWRSTRRDVHQINECDIKSRDKLIDRRAEHQNNATCPEREGGRKRGWET